MNFILFVRETHKYECLEVFIRNICWGILSKSKLLEHPNFEIIMEREKSLSKFSFTKRFTKWFSRKISKNCPTFHRKRFHQIFHSNPSQYKFFHSLMGFLSFLKWVLWRKIATINQNWRQNWFRLENKNRKINFVCF